MLSGGQTVIKNTYYMLSGGQTAIKNTFYMLSGDQTAIKNTSYRLSCDQTAIKSLFTCSAVVKIELKVIKKATYWVACSSQIE